MEERFHTIITKDSEARTKILNGVNAHCDAVGSTQGYRGNTVLLEKNGLPEPTKDGYTVSQSIFLKDQVEALGCEVCKEALKKTVDEAGDASTATAVLLQAFLQNSYKALEQGKSAIDIKLEIEKSVPLVLEYLKEISIPVTDKLIYDVAKTSANGDDEIAKLVANAFIEAGENGSVGHIRSNSDETFCEHTEGTLVERGYVDELFVNIPSNQSIIFNDNPLVLISNINFLTVKQITPFLDISANENRELVIISEMDFSVREVILQNKLKGFKFAVVTPPSHGVKQRDLLTDLAMVCGTQMLSTLSGSDFTGKAMDFLGVAKSVTITKDNTVIVRHDSTSLEPINGKIADLKEQIKASTNHQEVKNLNERISKLSGGISMIKVGGITPSEVEEKIARVDDAICAVRSAKEEGILAGGGVALLSAYTQIQNLDKVTSTAILSPIIKILFNAGVLNQDNIMQKLFDVIISDHEYPFGYDVKNFCSANMIEAGIVDSTKAIRNAYVNAVSASNTLLMTNNVITLTKS